MILGWLNRKAEAKLRGSQIRMLYQNQKALVFLLDYVSPMVEVKMPGADSYLSALQDAASLTETAILRLTYQANLDDQNSSELLLVNNMLKNFYAEIVAARTALVRLGDTRGPISPFAEMFKLPRGWETLSDRDWDDLVTWAMDGAKRSLQDP